MTEKKELTVTDRAIKALDVNETLLRELVLESKEIITIANAAGFAQAQSARMKLRSARVNIEKLGKSAREDAQAFSKAVIEQEKKYIGIVSPEESRLQSIQDEFTAKIEAEKQAKIDAENKRKEDIQAAIDELSPDLRFGDTSASIQAKIDRISAIEINQKFAERITEADEKKAESLAELKAALQSVLEAEAAKALQEAARIKAEQEAAEQRALAEKAAHEAARIHAEQIAEQQRIEAAKRAEAERIAAEERKKLEQQQAEERAARIKAEKEADRLRAEARAIEEKRLADEAAKAEAERKAAAAPDKERMLAYADSLIALKMPEMSTAIGKEAKVGIEQAVLNLHKRIVAKAEEL